MEVRVRRAVAGESDAVAALLNRVRHQNIGSLPPPVHPFDDVQRWMRDLVIPDLDVWLAEVDDEAVGLMVLRRPDWLEHLYVDANFTGSGIGSRLVDVAKGAMPERIQLWTFQSNAGGRRFYERHSFTAVQWTNGDNEEGAPDVRYVWSP